VLVIEKDFNKNFILVEKGNKGMDEFEALFTKVAQV
jgi:hypothetical protein